MSLTRRALLGYCGATVGMLALGKAAWVAGNDESLLRPPGAQDTDHLFAACIKCERCRSVCPTGVIVDSTLSDGIVSARTPKLDFQRGPCTFCDLCLQACPTGAIRPFDAAQEKVGMAVVQPDRCLAFDSGCRVCADACDYLAIELDENGIPVVSEALCNGCGECEYVCPALVLRSFPGGKRRGIVIVDMKTFEDLGSPQAALEGGPQ